jgi:hypothetical protein
MLMLALAILVFYWTRQKRSISIYIGSLARRRSAKPLSPLTVPTAVSREITGADRTEQPRVADTRADFQNVAPSGPSAI